MLCEVHIRPIHWRLDGSCDQQQANRRTMSSYKLYLESGPRRKKTMVHVLQLLGCTTNGPTTEEALDRTPQAIHAFHRFLERHGQPVENDGLVELVVAEHVTEGIWLGNGDPSIIFEPDLEPVGETEMEQFIGRLAGMGQEVAQLVSPLSQSQREEMPARGRPIETILAHVLESEVAYMQAFGRLEGLPGNIVEKRQGELLAWTEQVRRHEFEKLRSLSAAQRSESFIFWKHKRTARKILRRMLEHQWEHLVEIADRLDHRM